MIKYRIVFKKIKRKDPPSPKAMEGKGEKMDKARFVSTLPMVGEVVRVCALNPRSTRYLIVFETKVISRVSEIALERGTRDQDGTFMASDCSLELECVPLAFKDFKYLEFKQSTKRWTASKYPNTEFSVEVVR
jgi:hypothetical protein